MNDATLSGSADAGCRPPDAQLVRIVQQLVPLLGESEGQPEPLEGGMTNRNFRARFGGRRAT